MALFSFLKKRKKVSLIIDIGSASVGGAFVLKDSVAPEIVYSFRIPLAPSQEVSNQKLTELVLSTVEMVVKSLMQQAHIQGFVFDKAYYFLSSPWVSSYIHTTNIVRESPVQVTSHFVHDVVEDEIKAFIKTLGSSFLGDDYILVKQETLRMMLNGYEAVNPYGKKARQIEVYSQTSCMSHKMKDVLTLIIERYAHIEAIFSSFTGVLHAFISKNFIHEKKYIACDVTGESTDILCVSQGIPFFTGTIPLGRNHIIRAISKAFAVGPDLALSYINLYSDKVLEPAIAEKINSLIADVKNEWVSLFKDTSLKYSFDQKFEKIFITADEGIGKIWSSFFMASNSASSNSDVILLSFSSLQVMKFIGYSSGDPFLALEALDIHR